MIALVDVDGHNFPNFALMKIAAWWRQQGETVKWYDPLFDRPDRIYKSKVFTFTPDTPDYCDCEIVRGGTGYRLYEDLAPEIDAMKPDYSIYPQYDYAIGFLSRGCIRNCPWCIVPRKEGKIRQYDDIETVSCGRRDVVLMDNNFLANERGFIAEQLEKARRLKLRIDFNQALDARLVDEENARWLAACHWSKYIRFSCDTMGVIEPVKAAIRTMRAAGYRRKFFIYILTKEVESALERIRELTAFDAHVSPFVMPYRNLYGDGKIADKRCALLANWCNQQAVRKSCTFEEFKRR